ncbi:response regulator transcription factor [Mesorhizobium onobrychidis]|uniref:Response regulator n=1 Tax=Mesorhizobium onobrychidis TaxID=2775404 RepID=A0ABY5QQQ6_9HYPH|nr:response regulator [Mesorhizobium onobrychidis]UVC13368.1 response regulator [Mesorhizobium onobrychidis]
MTRQADQRRVVAVVEDDSSMRTSLERLLNAHGFLTQGFSSAEAFLHRDTTSRIGCLVLDIHLEGMSGIELRQRLKDAGSRLPVIFITAVDDAALEQQGAKAGCIAYLHKPFPAALLIDAVNRALGPAPTASRPAVSIR